MFYVCVYAVKIPFHVLLLVLGAAMSLAGCGNADKTIGQAAARVDGNEITVHQISDQVARAGLASGDTVAREALEALINQQVLINKAVAEKLDRTPHVMQALERAKREVLAQAYVEKLIIKTAPPTDEAVIQYYNAHPELFAQRRVYTLRQLAMPPGSLTPALQAEVDQASSLDTVTKWLQGKNISTRLEVTTQPAESLPAPLLAQLTQLSKGQMIIINAPTHTGVLQVADIVSQPVSETEALPGIQRYLAAQQHSEALLQKIDTLRQAAAVEYLGDFAKKAEATSLQTEPNVPSQNDKVDFITRGAAGLK